VVNDDLRALLSFRNQGMIRISQEKERAFVDLSFVPRNHVY
jgi:hypothetical protein